MPTGRAQHVESLRATSRCAPNRGVRVVPAASKPVNRGTAARHLRISRTISVGDHFTPPARVTAGSLS